MEKPNNPKIKFADYLIKSVNEMSLTTYALPDILVKWKVIFCSEFELEFDDLPQFVQEELLAYACLLQEFGSALGRPHVDTLKNSKYANMKELRFKVNGGVWRVAFAFDPTREAILLGAGNKSGKNEKLFYKQLIKKADRRYKQHLSFLEIKNGYIN